MDLLNLLDKIGLVFDIWGYPIVFFASLFEITPLGWAVPGGTVLVIAGYLANDGNSINLISTIIYGTLGTWLAFIFAYQLGSKTGMWLVRKLKQEKTARFAKKLLQNNGATILTTSMLANLTRFWVSYIAGVDKYSFLRFNLYAFIASITWVALMVLIGFFAGFERQILRNIVSKLGYLAWGLLFLAIFVIVRSVKHEYKHFKEDEPYHENHK
jgi:membrane protein DedA with SNARE-associated domain